MHGCGLGLTFISQSRPQFVWLFGHSASGRFLERPRRKAILRFERPRQHATSLSGSRFAPTKSFYSAQTRAVAMSGHPRFHAETRLCGFPLPQSPCPEARDLMRRCRARVYTGTSTRRLTGACYRDPGFASQSQQPERKLKAPPDRAAAGLQLELTEAPSPSSLAVAAGCGTAAASARQPARGPGSGPGGSRSRELARCHQSTGLGLHSLRAVPSDWAVCPATAGRPPAGRLAQAEKALTAITSREQSVPCVPASASRSCCSRVDRAGQLGAGSDSPLKDTEDRQGSKLMAG